MSENNKVIMQSEISTNTTKHQFHASHNNNPALSAYFKNLKGDAEV